ncbi:unnamed protein product [Sphenostylis stenocarpa]|uniref:Uncharacterized protein n=1 Tax=Sphenostylis stenocarpa TaxID=92480 RepID=A0AA86VY82_9FABA|nr:unnamed protein product [Sphenostylis stenocarpa]
MGKTKIFHSQGIMLLWTSTSDTPSQFHTFYAAIIFLALGNSGQKLTENFLEYQLEEKIEARQAVGGGSTHKKKELEFMDKVLIRSWMYAPCVVGYIITIIYAFVVDDKYEHTFRFAALFMGGTYMVFLAGSAWYSREELPVESNLRKIYRILKAALWKRGAKYPTSPSRYYWKGCKQDHHYKHREGVRLVPPVPRLCRWLDKAAILEPEDSRVGVEVQEKNMKLCTVKDVREVKSLVPMFYLGFAFFGYSLLVATENTFFVAQASNMTSKITKNDNDIFLLFLIKEGVSDVSRFICFLIGCAFRRLKHFKFIDNVCNKKAAIVRIGFGMVFAVICSLIAWKVEVGRLNVNKEMGYIEEGRNSTVALVPQFSLMGITEGLVEGGMASLFRRHVAKSMWSFGDAFGGLVIGSGKLLIIPLVLGIPSWFKDTLNASRLDRFYLMLGILNAVFLLVFAYYSFMYAYKVVCPEDDQPDSESSQVEESKGENPDFVESTVEIQLENNGSQQRL